MFARTLSSQTSTPGETASVWACASVLTALGAWGGCKAYTYLAPPEPDTASTTPESDPQDSLSPIDTNVPLPLTGGVSSEEETSPASPMLRTTDSSNPISQTEPNILPTTKKTARPTGAATTVPPGKKRLSITLFATPRVKQSAQNYFSKPSGKKYLSIPVPDIEQWYGWNSRECTEEDAQRKKARATAMQVYEKWLKRNDGDMPWVREGAFPTRVECAG